MTIDQFIKAKKETVKTKLSRAKATAKRTVRTLVLATVVVAAIDGFSVYKTIEIVTPHMHPIYSAAKLIDGEARGESHRGQKAVFATILNRVEDKRFPSTFHAVIYQPYPKNKKILQYNAMGDHVHEDLSTEVGQLILLRTAWWYMQAQLGLFTAPKEAENAHSYCVRSACEKQKGYFGTLKLVGTIGNHDFYGDCDCAMKVVMSKEQESKPAAPTTSPRPKARPNSGSELAPKTSPRPKQRPVQSPSQTEQVGNEIDRLIAEVISDNN